MPDRVTVGGAYGTEEPYGLTGPTNKRASREAEFARLSEAAGLDFSGIVAEVTDRELDGLITSAGRLAMRREARIGQRRQRRR